MEKQKTKSDLIHEINKRTALTRRNAKANGLLSVNMLVSRATAKRLLESSDLLFEDGTALLEEHDINFDLLGAQNNLTFRLSLGLESFIQALFNDADYQPLMKTLEDSNIEAKANGLAITSPQRRFTAESFLR